ncbi:MAG: GDP-L-fucose synthase [Thermoanaerobaculia bacterium]|nr:GDP-L-fucose synthase [Thermoanaerobaculia bacterium]
MTTPTRYLVTGGGGFLGSHVVERLRADRGNVVVAPRSAEFDLLVPDDVDRLLELARPHVVIHAAAKVGGIGANRLHPGSFFRDNALMGIHLVEACRTHPGARELRKFVQLGTICAYPKFTPVPFREEELWNGYPEETNAPYGIAKKALLVMLQGYRQEYGFPGVYLLPVNLYGPRDNFDLLSSHVIPAMLRKLLEAKERGEKTVTLWGDGTPTREFLYVEDAAEAIVAAAERYEEADPVNVGSGEEISMRDLAEAIRALVGFEGSITWDTSQPNGQPRRRLDTSRALERFGWKATTPLAEGLKKTLDWYRAEKSRTEKT